MSVAEVEKALGMGVNSLYAWKKKVPNGVSLEKTADYFDVTVDYLLGREDKNNNEIKNPEIRILARQLDNEFDDEQIEEFKNFAQFLRHKKFGDKKDGNWAYSTTDFSKKMQCKLSY